MQSARMGSSEIIAYQNDKSMTEKQFFVHLSVTQGKRQGGNGDWGGKIKEQADRQAINA